VKFNQWLADELDARKMKPQDLANAGDIDPATVSAILNERREVGPDVARRIAKGLQLEQWEVFYAAELITEVPKAAGQLSPVMVSIMRELRRCDEQTLRLFLAWLRVSLREISTWEQYRQATEGE